jgi:hypothetical protein
VHLSSRASTCTSPSQSAPEDKELPPLLSKVVPLPL